MGQSVFSVGLDNHGVIYHRIHVAHLDIGRKEKLCVQFLWAYRSLFNLTHLPEHIHYGQPNAGSNSCVATPAGIQGVKVSSVYGRSQ